MSFIRSPKLSEPNHLSVRGPQLAGTDSVTLDSPHDRRVASITEKLGRSRKGSELAGIVSLVLRRLTDNDLALVDAAIQSLMLAQSQYESEYAGYYGKAKTTYRQSVFDQKWDEFSSSYVDNSPFALIVEFIAEKHSMVRIKGLAEFGWMQGQNQRTIANTYVMMVRERMDVTEGLLKTTMDTIDEIRSIQGFMVMVNPFPAATVIRAIKAFPDQIPTIIETFRQRRSLDSLREVMSVTPAIAEGAL